MDSIESILDRHFPAQLDLGNDPMAGLASLKDKLKSRLPGDSTIEITMLMNSVVLTVWSQSDRKKYTRTALAKAS